MHTITVKYDSHEIELKRVPRSKYKDLIILQQKLINQFVVSNGSIGEIIAEESNWQLMKDIAAMIPVVGTDKVGFDIEALENDLDQLTRIFYTQAVEENGAVNLNDGFKPSLISEFHSLNFIGMLGNAVQAKQEMELQEEMKKSEKKPQKKLKED